MAAAAGAAHSFAVGGGGGQLAAGEEEEVEMLAPPVNILITGTPGTGKSTTSQLVADLTGWHYIDVGAVVREKECHEGRNDEYDAFVLDEDKLCDELEPLLSKGECIVDFHSCGFMPERWFQLVVILRTDNEKLYPRLEARGYDALKIGENMEAEIMQVVQDEATEAYPGKCVIVASDSIEQLEQNVQSIGDWIAKRCPQGGQVVAGAGDED